MKVPLDKEPFPPVVLTRGQEQQLEWLADTLLDETLSEYKEFVEVNQRTLDPSKWKHAMSRESVSIYKRVGKGDLGGTTPDVTLDKPTREAASLRWRVPRILGVGTMVGSLDDLLYGYLAQTTTDTQVRKHYIQDEAADVRVLANIIRPTNEQPLRSLLVRWSLFCNFLHRLGVSQRDVINFESMGVREMANGERIGYVMSQSVDIPGCDPLSDLGVIRTKFSSCYIFRDTGDGTVELFMRGFIEPYGNMAEGVAVVIAAGTMILAWRLMISSHSKKLTWLLQQAATSRRTNSHASDHDRQEDGDDRSCRICHKAQSRLRPPARCDVCRIKFCGRCVDKHKLVYVNALGDITRTTSRVCKTCVVRSANTNALDVARKEHVCLHTEEAPAKPVDSLSTTSSSFQDEDSGFRPHYDSVNSVGSELALVTPLARRSPHVRPSPHSMRSPHAKPSFHTRTSSQGAVTPMTRSKSSSNSTPIHAASPEQEMWMRMNQLRMTAEQTYNITQQNANVMKACVGSYGD